MKWYLIWKAHYNSNYNSNSLKMYSGFQNAGDHIPRGMSDDPLGYKKNILRVLFMFNLYFNTCMYFKYNVINEIL